MRRDPEAVLPPKQRGAGSPEEAWDGALPGPSSGLQEWPWQEHPRAQHGMGARSSSSPAWHLLVSILDSYRVGPIGGRGVVDSVGAISIVTHLHGLGHTWARRAGSAEPLAPIPPPSILPQTFHTCGAQYSHLQGGSASLTAVHREGLGYPGPDTGPQPWSRALHLPRVYHVLHGHPEWTPWEEKGYQPLPTCQEGL